MWKEDGWGWRARIGLLVPHGDVCPESEFNAMAPTGVSIHATRVPFTAMHHGLMDPTIPHDPVREIVEPPAIDEAAALLADAPVHVIGFAFTSSSFVLGSVGDDALVTRLEQATGGIPVLVACRSAIEAMRALTGTSLALITPPWFDDDLTDLGRRYFVDAGFDVVHASSANIPSGQSDVHPGNIYEYVRQAVPSAAEMIFLGGNGFRTVGVIDALEADLGRPVLTANQALLWHALRIAGVDQAVAGYGSLFRLTRADLPDELVPSAR